MFKPSAIFVATLILLQTPYLAAQEAPVAAAAADPSFAERFDAVIGSNYKATDPGITVLVARDGKPLLRKAYGMANIEKKQAMTPEMSLRLGSITKQFTAVSILMLADEGKLSVQDDITKHLPDYPTKGKRITIEHLLTHTSGIVSYTSKPGFMAAMNTDLTVAQMIDTFKNDPLEFEPGSRYAYNNSGYFLLGAIIEKISGQSYAKFVEQRIFVPLGMTQTAYEGYERTPPLRAAGYSKKGDAFEPSAPLSMALPYAAGSLVSTVDDLNRWDQAIAQGKLLKPASWKMAFTPYTLADGKSTNYGYGWAIGNLKGSPMIGHGGGINGFATYALRLPQEKVYVVVLGNADSGNVAPEMMAMKAAALAIGKPYTEYKEITLDAKALAAFAGVYGGPGPETRTIRVENGRLSMARSGGNTTLLRPHSENGFFVGKSLITADFARDAKGAVTRVTVSRDGNSTVYPRTGDAAALPARVEVKVAPAVLDSYVGKYQLAPNFIIEVRREGEKFIAQATNQPPFELFATSDTNFFVKVVDAQVNFTKNPDGSHVLVLNQGGRTMPAPLVK
ncbi:serine hydrolase [Pseudoduganella aquatica]|uniref:Serine hydrolase n=1 Tax=Pseudoduganella aquatica TaxID=2660641 RepID=A0A7X4KL39_9BURK|nr:serine hydrolase [Pseudoduganella aquatica]MYN06762.1 serine hydrolase [Pseudoduganella aquatica]